MATTYIAAAVIWTPGKWRVFVPASAVPEPAPQQGEHFECYGIVSTYAGAKELTVRDARDLVRVDQE
jgi:DNA/RNA endonuclease YhcR with UshA esterase domain